VAGGEGADAVRVLTDVAGLDREFDYAVPPALAGQLPVGTQVRVALGGRRVGGWVTATATRPPEGVDLRPVARRRGWGPPAVILELAGWAAHRWAGRRSAVLATASAEHAVPALPRPAGDRPPAPRVSGPAAAATAELVGVALARPPGRPVVLRLPPAADLVPVVARVGQRGPVLVVTPTHAGAEALAGRLARAGAGVALLPGGWAQARAGAAVVVGARAACWGPCPGLAAAVVVDGHDEALHQEQAPTWDAATVTAERARRAGVPCLVTSPCPTPDLAAAADVLTLPAPVERAGWAPVEILDRRGDDPRLGLWSERLVALARSGARVACVLNRTGRARLLACRSCGTVARCERCGAAVAEGAGGDGSRELTCPRCALIRPWVCASCGSSALRRLRLGVARAAEDLATLTGRPVQEVTAATPPGAADGDLAVGTEAVLHRGGRYDAVAFLDLDGDLLAPRFRAAEEALALLARACRLVPARAGGRVLVQTRVPDHPVITAAATGDPGGWLAGELELRASLGLPPFAALAALGGDGAPELARILGADPTVELQGPSDGRWLVRAPAPGELADALARAGRPAARVRIEVDPLRV
jgi:primosomal protein N' (replication factor Y)